MEQDLNKTKLFATIVYKTFFPGDFAKLHNLEGIFAELLDKHAAIKAKKKARLVAKRESYIADASEHKAAALTSRISVAYAYMGIITQTSQYPVNSYQFDSTNLSYACDPEEFLNAALSNPNRARIRSIHSTYSCLLYTSPSPRDRG